MQRVVILSLVLMWLMRIRRLLRGHLNEDWIVILIVFRVLVSVAATPRGLWHHELRPFFCWQVCGRPVKYSTFELWREVIPGTDRRQYV